MTTATMTPSTDFLALARGRRIEALTGEAAEKYVAERETALNEAAALLQVDPAAVPEKVRALLDERRKLERRLADTRRQMATGGSGEKKEKKGDAVSAALQSPGVFGGKSAGFGALLN